MRLILACSLVLLTSESFAQTDLTTLNNEQLRAMSVICTQQSMIQGPISMAPGPFPAAISAGCAATQAERKSRVTGVPNMPVSADPAADLAWLKMMLGQ